MGQGNRSHHAIGWQCSDRVFRLFTRRLLLWRHRRILMRAKIELNALKKCALSASNDIARDCVIVSVNVLLGKLQAGGVITGAERRDLACEWIKDYVRGRLPAFYREKNAKAIDRLGWFLKAS